MKKDVLVVGRTDVIVIRGKTVSVIVLSGPPATNT
jgi:hypothetical protein